MIILHRKKNEAIVIGDNITVVVVEIRDDKVRLGFEIPKEMPLHRKEVYDAIQRSVPAIDGKMESVSDSCEPSPDATPDPGTISAVDIPISGMEALEKIRSTLLSPPKDDGSLIAIILDVIAEEGMTLDQLTSLVKKT